MENITLEKVDMIRERTNASYELAKEALEACNGDVLDALIYVEKKQKEMHNDFKDDYKSDLSLEEFKAWIKDLINKGNITRIKIKKDETELIDIPVNAGIAAGFIAIIIPPILAAGVIAAVATQITIEITRADGSVEVVNKYVSKMTDDVKTKASDFADMVKNKMNEVKTEAKNNADVYNKKVDVDNKEAEDEKTSYTYQVTFDDNDVAETTLNEDKSEN